VLLVLGRKIHHVIRTFVPVTVIVGEQVLQHQKPNPTVHAQYILDFSRNTFEEVLLPPAASSDAQMPVNWTGTKR
jgi:hypothetical protein